MHFINEVHFDSIKCMSQRVLRNENISTKTHNMQEMSSKNIIEIDLHITTSMFYYHKSSLIFYNNDNEIFLDITIKKQKIRKSRRHVDESNENYEKRLIA